MERKPCPHVLQYTQYNMHFFVNIQPFNYFLCHYWITKSILQWHTIQSVDLYDAAACPLSHFCPGSGQRYIRESGKYAVGLKPAFTLSHACPLWNLIWAALIRSSITQYKTHCRYILMHNCKVSNDFSFLKWYVKAGFFFFLLSMHAACFTFIQLHTFAAGSSPI